jgi:uncharacterized Zn-binding protein involved in type VI secretion
MSRPQARVGDRTSHGGVIVTGAARTFVNGRKAARKGDLHVCPIYGHGIRQITTGSQNTLIEGKAAARVGDQVACGAVIVRGSPNTFTN